MRIFSLAVLWLLILFPFTANSARQVTALFTEDAVVIDGVGLESIWKSTPTLTTMDAIDGIPVELQAAYSNDYLYLKVRLPDSTENRHHKMLIWDKPLNGYRTGNTREDSFVIKWNMEPLPTDLKLYAEQPYRADIWYWKAFRSDTIGYADDKMHIYSTQQDKKSKKITTTTGKIMYLSRLSDEGKSSYKSIAYETYSGDKVVRYKHRQPTGSRSDIRAKGNWKNGYWTIEFQRKLQTGYNDDLQFQLGLSYLFGISKFEIGGKQPNMKLEQPNYESGDIGEMLELVFQEVK